MSPETVTVPPPHGVETVAGTPVGALWMPPLDRPCPNGTERLLTLANLDAAHVTVELSPQSLQRAMLVSSTDPDRARGEVDPARLILLPGEVVVLLVQSERRPT